MSVIFKIDTQKPQFKETSTLFKLVKKESDFFFFKKITLERAGNIIIW